MISHRRWIARELSGEVGLSHQGCGLIEALGRSVADIHTRHLADGILRLPDIWQKVQDFSDYIEGM